MYELEEEAFEVDVAEDEVFELVLEDEAFEVDLVDDEVFEVGLAEEEELELDVGAAVRQEQAELILTLLQSRPSPFGNGMPPRRSLNWQNSVGSGTSAVLVNVLKQLALLQLAASLARNSLGAVEAAGGRESTPEAVHFAAHLLLVK